MMLRWLITAAEVPESTSNSVQIWLAIIAIVAPITAVVAPILANKGKNKSGMNVVSGPEAKESVEQPPKPPVVRDDGQVDAAASVVQLYETLQSVHARQKRSEAENQKLRQDVFQLDLKIKYLEKHHKSAMSQLITWAIHLSGNPPHPVPGWVQELVNTAKEG